MSKTYEHYSPHSGLKELSPEKMGTSGVTGAQYKRGLPEHKSVFLYRKGATPEETVKGRAKAKYEVDLPKHYKVYDSDSDPHGLKKKTREENHGAWNEDMYHANIKKAGYHGVEWEQTPGVHVLQSYETVPISKEHKMAEGGDVKKPVKINPKHGKLIADAYEAMQHKPDDPRVKAAYAALAKETLQQYDKILKSGLTITKIKPGEPNPYKSSKDLHEDIEKNHHLYYFPTEQGFGADDPKAQAHPMLAPVPHKDDEGQQMVLNDVFRIVHDVNGHHHGGKSGFGALGEHKAYLQHKKMFSPLAGKALATETMGQNNWVNWGPYGEQNRANPANTRYADQKAGLLPDQILNYPWHEGEE